MMDIKRLMLASKPEYEYGYPDIILTGSEMDALILNQELEGITAAWWMQEVPGPDALAILATVRRWWVLPDAPNEILRSYPRAHALPWPRHQESIRDAFLAEADLVAWALGNLGPAGIADRALWLEQIIRQGLGR